MGLVRSWPQIVWDLKCHAKESKFNPQALGRPWHNSKLGIKETGSRRLIISQKIGT